jgi:hypothetical protein
MNTKLSWLVVSALLAVGGQAPAAVVQFDFTGVASSVPDPFNDFGGTVSVGDPFSGSVTFDLDTPDIQALPDIGFYVQSPVTTGGLTAAVGPLTFLTQPGSDFKVTVINDSTDELLVTSTLIDSVGHLWNSEWRLGYFPGASGPFVDDSLPTSLDLDDFNVFLSLRLSSSASTGGFADSFWGDLQTLNQVPEPSSIALATMGVVGLALLRCRKRKCRPAESVN